MAARSPVRCPAGRRVIVAQAGRGAGVVPGQPLVEQAEGKAGAGGDGWDGAVGIRLGFGPGLPRRAGYRRRRWPRRLAAR